jgi:hypothetical protein
VHKVTVEEMLALDDGSLVTVLAQCRLLLVDGQYFVKIGFVLFIDFLK